MCVIICMCIYIRLLSVVSDEFELSAATPLSVRDGGIVGGGDLVERWLSCVCMYCIL